MFSFPLSGLQQLAVRTCFLDTGFKDRNLKVKRPVEEMSKGNEETYIRTGESGNQGKAQGPQQRE